MFSGLRKDLLYTDISTDIMEHDEDIDAEEWSYNDKSVFKGVIDPRYTEKGLDVYWLYDENLNRVGLAEHETEDHAKFNVLWFHENEFGTLLQEDWESDGTLWNKLTQEAYQDLLEDDFNTILLKGIGHFVTPEYIIHGLPEYYECECGFRSFSSSEHHIMKKSCITLSSPIYFIDKSYSLFQVPSNSIVWSRLGLQHDGDDHRQQVQNPEEEVQPLPAFLQHSHLQPVAESVESPLPQLPLHQQTHLQQSVETAA